MISTTRFGALAASLLAFSSQLVDAGNCSISFDGRIPRTFQLSDFDSNDISPYDSSNVIGSEVSWSEAIRFPKQRNSGPFCKGPGCKPFEVTINDKSIFAPSPTNVQVGFRRAELLASKFPVSSDDSTTGVRTLHFSLKANSARPLNFSHEYQLVFQEDASYSTNQFVLKTGTLFGSEDASAEPVFLLQGNQNKSPPDLLFSTPFDQRVTHNFAITEDFNENTIQVYYSTGHSQLKARTAPLPNEVTGGGQFHFGILKKPTGEGLTDITKEGFQPSGIKEGIIYSGIYQERSENGCIDLGTPVN